MAAEQRMAAADVMIGPPPPEMVQEAEAIPGDARSAEVVRVLKYGPPSLLCHILIESLHAPQMLTVMLSSHSPAALKQWAIVPLPPHKPCAY